MRKNIPSILQFIALVMFIIGLVMSVICILKGNDAGRGYFTRDASAQAMWYIGIIPSVMTVFWSFVIWGFSYVVEASCRYIEKCDEQDAPEE